MSFLLNCNINISVSAEVSQHSTGTLTLRQCPGCFQILSLSESRTWENCGRYKKVDESWCLYYENAYIFQISLLTENVLKCGFSVYVFYQIISPVICHLGWTSMEWLKQNVELMFWGFISVVYLFPLMTSGWWGKYVPPFWVWNASCPNASAERFIKLIVYLNWTSLTQCHYLTKNVIAGWNIQVKSLSHLSINL